MWLIAQESAHQPFDSFNILTSIIIFTRSTSIRLAWGLSPQFQNVHTFPICPNFSHTKYWILFSCVELFFWWKMAIFWNGPLEWQIFMNFFFWCKLSIFFYFWIFGQKSLVPKAYTPYWGTTISILVLIHEHVLTSSLLFYMISSDETFKVVSFCLWLTLFQNSFHVGCICSINMAVRMRFSSILVLSNLTSCASIWNSWACSTTRHLSTIW